MKILWYSDFLCPTGFGNVAEALISRLQKTGHYEFTVIAFNYYGDPYNIKDSPYYDFRDIPVYPASDYEDPYGHDKLLKLAANGKFDAVFVLHDPFHMLPVAQNLSTVCHEKDMPLIFYFPVDGDLMAGWEIPINVADLAVTYTEYGRSKVAERTDKFVQIVPHGVDRDIFQPVPREEAEGFRKSVFRAEPEDFVITNVNRNQPRKDLARTILVWLEVKKTIENAKLYVHTNPSEPHKGWDLNTFVLSYVPQEFRGDVMWASGHSFPLNGMRYIYSASDIVMSTSLGEGWGLSTTEAMACNVPVVMPRHSANTEIIGVNEERGLLVECTDSIVLPAFDHNRVRPLVNIYSMAAAICDVHKRPASAGARADLATAWIKEHCDWDSIAEDWDSIFRVAVQG